MRKIKFSKPAILIICFWGTKKLLKWVTLSLIIFVNVSCNTGRTGNSEDKIHGKFSDKPNLVFVFSDQQSSDMLGCYGNTDLITPNLDKLAAEGVRFKHCISNSPICTPYRAMLFSGQYPLRNGAFGNDIRMFPGNGNYFAEVLRDNGYRTGYYGKWHLYGGDRNRPIPPGPYRYGFDHEFLSNNCTTVFDKERAYYWDENGKKQMYGDWEPYAQTRQAIEFINEHSNKPFALFVSWHPPHNPYGAPEDLMQLYDPSKLKLRPNTDDNAKIRNNYQGHLAMITGIDRAFGWLMEALKEKGIEDNTILVFTSDHGDALGSHGNMVNKMRPELESIRVPLIIRHPEQLKPRVSNLLIGTLDLMPTLLGMMQLPVPETCDGHDLSRAIKEQKDDALDAIPIFLPSRDFRGVFTGRFTYCYDSSVGGEFEYRDQKHPPDRFDWNILYDHRVDPNENINRYESPEYKDILDQLHAETLSWMDKLGDKGWSYQEIIETSFSDEDKEFQQTKRAHLRSGVLIGKPIELLK